MKFHITTAADRNLFTGYGAGYVAINQQRYDYPVLVLPEQAVQRWDVTSFDALTPEHFTSLLAARPEIILFGSGTTLRFARHELTRAITTAAVGFETMDTAAACRTYNVLTAEGRQVLAALLV
ncbi:MAG: Mth938-like domain-containing protein [Pseudomonadota bacterium]